MTARRYTRPLAIAALLGVLAASNVVPTHAATPVPDGPTDVASYRYGELGPPVLPTPAQLADHAQRLAAYQAEVAHVARASGRVQPDGDPGNYGGLSGSVYVIPSLEPGQPKYFNYCGVVSSLTVDSNWTNNLPTIDQMGSYEHVNQYIPGTRFSDMIGPINQYGNTGGFYMIQTATSQGQFNNFIGSDIYGTGHPLITDIRTQGFVPGIGYRFLKGWTNVNVDHIVAIWGFNFVTPGAGYIQYVEGSSAAAGNTAQGRNNYSADDFWGLVEDNSYPGQIW